MTPPVPPRRRPLRWQGFDYGTNHVSFVTICTAGRRPLLGWVDRDGTIHRSEAGDVVATTWDSLPDRFPNVRLHAFVAMPDHLHGILSLEPTADPSLNDGPSLVQIVGALKSLSAIAINRSLGRTGVPVWQRSFHDRVIRDDEEYAHMCWYIEENPVRWARRVAERRKQGEKD